MLPDTRAQIVRGHNQKASIDWRNKSYIASEVIPVLEMASEKEKVTKFNRGDAFRDTAVKRAEGTNADTSHYKLETENIDTTQYSSKNKVTKEAIRRQGYPVGTMPPINMQQRAITWNSNKLDLKLEIYVASQVLAGTWADGNAGGEDAAGAWTASSGNTFIEDVDKAINKLQDEGIPRENIRLMMDDKTWQGVIRVSDVTSALGYSAVQPKAPGLTMTKEMMASLLTIDKVLVGSAIYNTANEAADGSDFTVSKIWGGTKGYAFLYYYPPMVMPEEMSPGFIGKNKMENGAYRVTYQWYNNDLHTWFFESQEEFGYKQTTAQAGYLFKDTHTT